jgi:hypothetical protein
MMPSVLPSPLYLCLFAAGCASLALAAGKRRRSLVAGLLPAVIHRCRARPLFSHLGKSSFQLDALVEACDDPTVPRGMPFSLRLKGPTRRSDYLFSRVRASVERGHALFVEVEDYLVARKARLCANGWTVVLEVEHAFGWPAAPEPSAY